MTLLQDAIMSRVVETMDGCLEYQGKRTVAGYGLASILGKRVLAHRLSYEAFNNETITKGVYVCHTCDNPPCINPDHLWLGTARDNALDMVRKGRQNPPDRVGEAHPRTHLTEEYVTEILLSNVRTKDLSDMYDVSYSTVKAIKSGRNWSHVYNRLLDEGKI